MSDAVLGCWQIEESSGCDVMVCPRLGFVLSDGVRWKVVDFGERAMDVLKFLVEV